MGFCAAGRVGWPLLPPWRKNGITSSSPLPEELDEQQVRTEHEEDELELGGPVDPLIEIDDDELELEAMSRPR